MKKLLLSILCMLSLASNVKAVDDKLVTVGAATFILSAIGYCSTSCEANDLDMRDVSAGYSIFRPQIQRLTSLGNIFKVAVAAGAIIAFIGLAKK